MEYSKPVKYQTKCKDCNFKFLLDDGIPCIHQLTLGIGSFECPQCHNCICHGETIDQISYRFKSKFNDGKFIKSPVNASWQFQCITVEKITVST